MEAAKISQNDSKVLPIESYDTSSVSRFIESWKAEFVQRMETDSNSRKNNFTFRDAKARPKYFRPLDKIMIRHLDYIGGNPLKENDYFKYCDSYFKGKELNVRYFRHDLAKLKEYYKKIDKERETALKEGREPINLFSKNKWERYVLYMMLKLKGLYSQQFDKMFNVKKVGSREYNPITSINRDMRAFLPHQVKECDIVQAYHTFICLELGMEPFDVYQKIDKVKFNTTLNLHKDVKGANLAKARKELKPIYGDRSHEVLTDERFNTKGQMFEDLAKYEKQYIEKFVAANDLTRYVRLHDSVVVLDHVECDQLTFGAVKFREKPVQPPAVITDTITFYDSDSETTPARYKKFYQQEGFIRLSHQGIDEVSIIKNENKILRPFNHITDSVNFLRERIVEYDTEPLENHIARDSHAIQSGFLLMPGQPPNLQRDTKDEVFIPFADKVAKITADGVSMAPYDDPRIKFFAEHDTQKREFNYSKEAASKSVYGEFLKNAIIGRQADDNLTPKEENEILAFASMIGYLISNYKDPANAFAIILSDEGANDSTRNGRRGKGLVQEAVRQVRVFNNKGGDSFDPKYRHKYGDLKPEHDVYIIDDVPAGFNFNSFYSEIKESISVERKGREAELIDFSMTPKFLLSTNYAVRYNKDDASTIDRFMEYQFSDFWNIRNKPIDYFGQRFFTHWNPQEWNEFYSFMAECVQVFLKHGLTRIEYDKTGDNYRAYFHNEVIEQEFERILEVMKMRGSFSVHDFLQEYQSADNPLRFEKYFHQNNLKKILSVYLEHHVLDVKYSKDLKKWEFY